MLTLLYKFHTYSEKKFAITIESEVVFERNILFLNLNNFMLYMMCLPSSPSHLSVSYKEDKNAIVLINIYLFYQ